MSEILITAWFGGDPIMVNSLDDTDQVVYSWCHTDKPLEIKDLLVWHNCDRNVWLNNPRADLNVVRSSQGFTPAGAGLHELISVEPLHISPSLYWSECCGMHGFIREGKWVSA